MTYSVKFPAPGSLIDSRGAADPSGLPAPGFSAMTPKSNYTVSKQRSRSGRGLPITSGEHYWSFSVNYHPMLREQFEAIESFMFGHNTRLKPFYLTLPGYDVTTNVSFNTWLESWNVVTSGVHYAGDTELYIVEETAVGFAGNVPPVGCFINIDDPDDALHKATYKVARVETQANPAGDPFPFGIRLTVFPPLNRDIPALTPVRFIEPTFRVIQTNDIEPNIDKDGLYSFSLQFEEILP